MSDSVIANPNLYVISGGPGAGKTTLLRELAKRGEACVEEAARQIIQEQVQAAGGAVPWGDTTRYAELMLERSIADFVQHSTAQQPTFFDRGIPDVLCYARLIGMGEQAIRAACAKYKYNQLVFIAPPWQEIYTVDEERKQTFAEAVETCRLMQRSYQDCGYAPIDLPRVAVEDRAEFVMRRIALDGR